MDLLNEDLKNKELKNEDPKNEDLDNKEPKNEDLDNKEPKNEDLMNENYHKGGSFTDYLTDYSKEISLEEMLRARECRLLRQQALLRRFPEGALVCFTMNIAGPVKNSPLIRRGFLYGCELLKEQLLRFRKRPVYEAVYDEPTGNEGYFVFSLPPAMVKRLTAEIEDHDRIGRLFDMDVLDPSGAKLDREPLGFAPRTCLLCAQPARVCARSRTHPVAELRGKTDALLREFFRERDLRTIAQDACRALLYEVCTTPKPGLVDRNNSGSHRDMDIFTFMDSTTALQPYFRLCGEAGMDNRENAPEDTFAKLRQAGIEAERCMLRATRGVNTHKGSIFTMGLACAALGRLEHEKWSDPAAVLDACAQLAAGVTERDFKGLAAAKPGGKDFAGKHFAERDFAGKDFAERDFAGKDFAGKHFAERDFAGKDFAGKDSQNAAGKKAFGSADDLPLSFGEMLYLQYGIRGVRGQAEDGFPAVLNSGLPMLERELAAGADINRAGSVALLAILRDCTDTNLIARGGREAQLDVAAIADALLKEQPAPPQEVIAGLDRLFIEENLSPGGSADLLGLCYLLHFLRTEEG